MDNKPQEKQEPYENMTLCPLLCAGKPIVAQTEGRASANVQIGAQAQQGQERREIASKAERANDTMQGEFLVLPVRVALKRVFDI